MVRGDLGRFDRMKRRLLRDRMSWRVHRRHGRVPVGRMLSMPRRHEPDAPFFMQFRTMGRLTEVGRFNLTHPIAMPTIVNKITWTVVWKASRTTGASIPLRADFETSVTEMAHVEWNKMIERTFSRGPNSILSIVMITVW